MKKLNTSKAYKALIGNKYNSLLILILLLGFGFLTINITKPFGGLHEYDSLRTTFFAYNYVRFGRLVTFFAPLQYYLKSGDFPLNPSYYLDWPVLYPVFVSYVYEIFGFFEAVGRLVAISFSLGAVVIFYKIIKSLWNEKIALLSSLLIVISPMFFLFGKIVFVFAPLFFFFMLSVYYFMNYLQKNQNKYYYALIITLSISCGIGWPIYFLPPLMAFILCFRKKKEWSKILLLTLLPVFWGVLFLLYVYLVGGEVYLRELFQVYLYRTNGVRDGVFDPVTFFDILRIGIKNTIILFLFPTIVFASIGIYSFWKKRQPIQLIVIFLFFSLGFINIIIFRQAFVYHEYWGFLLLPFWGLFGGIGINFVSRYLRQPIIIYAVFSSYVMFILITGNYLRITDFRELSRTITEISENQRLIIIDDNYMYKALGYYLNRDFEWVTSKEQLDALLNTKDQKTIVLYIANFMGNDMGVCSAYNCLEIRFNDTYLIIRYAIIE